MAGSEHGARPVRPGRDAHPVPDPDLRARRGPAVADGPGRPAEVSRTTVAAEVGRLVELGLAAGRRPGRVAGWPAIDAGRPGRRAALRRHRAGRDVDAGRRSPMAGSACWPATAPRADIRRGPGAGARRGASSVTRKLLADQGVERPAGVGIGVPGPVDFQAGVPVSPPIMPGWDGYPVRDALSRELGLPGAARQRRQRDGAGRAAHRRRAFGVATSSSSRSAPASAAASWSTGTSTAAPTAAPATSGTSAVEQQRPGVRLRQPRAASRRSSAARRSPATPRPRREPDVGRAGRAARGSTGGSPPSTSGWRSARATRSPSSWSATAAGGSARCWPTWSRSSTPA